MFLYKSQNISEENRYKAHIYTNRTLLCKYLLRFTYGFENMMLCFMSCDINLSNSYDIFGQIKIKNTQYMTSYNQLIKGNDNDYYYIDLATQLNLFSSCYSAKNNYKDISNFSETINLAPLDYFLVNLKISVNALNNIEYICDEFPNFENELFNFSPETFTMESNGFSYVSIPDENFNPFKISISTTIKDYLILFQNFFHICILDIINFIGTDNYNSVLNNINKYNLSENFTIIE